MSFNWVWTELLASVIVAGLF